MILSKLRKKLEKKASSAHYSSSANDPLAGRVLVPTHEETTIASGTSSMPADGTQLVDQVQKRISRAQSFDGNLLSCLDKITFREPVSEATVLDCLRTYGLAIFPSVYSDSQLETIEKEYNDLIENGANLALDVAAREDTPANSYAIAIQRKVLNASRFPAIVALFGSRTVEKITEKFFAGQSFDYNGDLFVQWTDHTDVPASGPLHWDKQLTLKSWLYVTDATEGYGAMRAGVGTAAWTRYIREDAMFDGIPYKNIVNQVEESGFPIVSTGGPAGTFFLFVTDTAHGATPVDPGKRRNILRARSRPHRVKQWSSWANKL
ncbi:MAG: phytanoyl-CoA dioxygenase family protein [Roseobacter sp.]